MFLTAESGGRVAASTASPVLIYEPGSGPSDEIVAALEAQGSPVRRLAGSSETAEALRRERPALLILAERPEVGGESSPRTLVAAAHSLGIPVLGVVEPGTDPRAWTEPGGEVDDWVFRDRLASELPLRVAGLLRRRESEFGRASSVPADSRFFPLIVHDLRTPLNVIGLSLRMIDQAMPKGNAELEEDLRFVEENFKQIERMLSQLSDYCRLFEVDSPGSAVEFSPERLLAELVEARATRSSPRPSPIRLEVEASCPPEASLDPIRARQALQYALGNAVAAANGDGVRIRLRGGPDRWVTEFTVEQPPPASVKPVELRPHLFERLCGTAAERRGMDLAIAARISELFGGAARLEVVEDRRTTIVLDWPARQPAP